MCHYPDLCSASDLLKQIFHAAQPIRSITQIWIVTCYQCGILALFSQASFHAKCWLFSQAIEPQIKLEMLVAMKRKHIPGSQSEETNQTQVKFNVETKTPRVMFVAEWRGKHWHTVQPPPSNSISPSWHAHLNPSSPDSDQHQFSLINDTHTMSRGQVMRINKMIT